MAIEQSPCCKAWQARWIAVKDDEHMLSTAMLGPSRSKKYETRLAIEDGLPDKAIGLPRAVCSAP
jgi:hypothetical protein